MKNRTSLVLMEQLIMILVFSLAAAACLGIFVKADEISRNTASRDEAVLIAQNAAEILKATSGDADRTAEIVGPAAEEKGFSLVIEKAASGSPLLGSAEIHIIQDNKALFTLHTGWQEG